MRGKKACGRGGNKVGEIPSEHQHQLERDTSDLGFVEH